MLNAFSRRFWRVALGVCLAMTALAMPAGRAEALETAENQNLYPRLGTCTIQLSISPYVPPGTGETYVTVSGIFAGGNLFVTGEGVYPFPPALTAADLSSCGIADVTKFVSNGADGTFETDDYIGVSFRGRENGVLKDFEFALKGVTNTQLVATSDPVPNTAPTANAGPAQTVASGASVTLDGSASSDAEGSITYFWEPVGAAPGPALTGATTAKPTFTAPTLLWTDAPKVFEYTMTVTDANGDFNYESAFVTVNPPEHILPLAQAQTTEPTIYRTGDIVSLTSTGTITDPTGVRTNLWSTTAAGVTFTNPTGDNTTFTAPVVTEETEIMVTFTVTETTAGAELVAASTTVRITIAPDMVPEVDVSGPSSVAEGEVFEVVTSVFDDSVSAREFGQTSGPRANYEGRQIKGGHLYTVTAPAVPDGLNEVDLVFTLTVDDGRNAPVTASLTVTVTRNGPSAEETAKDLLRVLTELDLLRPHPEGPGARPAQRVFEATGDPEAFTALATRFLGPVITGVAPAVHRTAT